MTYYNSNVVKFEKLKTNLPYSLFHTYTKKFSACHKKCTLSNPNEFEFVGILVWQVVTALQKYYSYPTSTTQTTSEYI